MDGSKERIATARELCISLTETVIRLLTRVSPNCNRFQGGQILNTHITDVFEAVVMDLDRLQYGKGAEENSTDLLSVPTIVVNKELLDAAVKHLVAWSDEELRLQGAVIHPFSFVHTETVAIVLDTVSPSHSSTQLPFILSL